MRRSSATRARSSARCPSPDSDRLGRLLVHTPLPAAVAREIVVWTRERRARSAPQPPRAVHRPADDPRCRRVQRVHGRRSRAVPRPRRRHQPPDHEGPRRRRAAAADRARAAGARAVRGRGRRHHQPSAVPRVRRARASRRAGPSAGWRGASRSRSGRRWRSATSGTTSRCSPRSGTGRRCRPPRPRCSAVARYIAPPLADEGVARMIEALVLAPPDQARLPRSDWPRRRRRPARRGPPGRPPSRSRSRSRHDRADRPRRRGGSRRGDRGPARRRRRRAADRHGLRHRGRARRPGRHRAAVPCQEPAPGPQGSCCCSRRQPRRPRSG